jgi:hypothetical protein
MPCVTARTTLLLTLSSRRAATRTAAPRQESLEITMDSHPVSTAAQRSLCPHTICDRSPGLSTFSIPNDVRLTHVATCLGYW